MRREDSKGGHRRLQGRKAVGDGLQWKSVSVRVRRQVIQLLPFPFSSHLAIAGSPFAQVREPSVLRST